jgi:predicted SnoaL-like aldol condensation-catalyzing enzyme
MRDTDGSLRLRALAAGLTLSMVLVPACLLSACATQAARCGPEEANRRLVADFVHVFYEERDVRRAFEQYVSADYIQHNPNIPDGREAAIAALTPLFSRKEVELQVRHVVVDGDMAVVHLFAREGTAARGAAVADVFRLSHGRIVEHWDILQAIPENPINPHPMF